MKSHPGTSKCIPLTQEQNALVDDADYEELSRYRWRASWDPSYRVFVAVRSLSTAEAVKLGKRRGNLYMHRQIMGNPKGKVVNHKNHDTLDNRRDNLEVCTNKQNCRYRRVDGKNNKSGYKGVFRNNSRFVASITINCKNKYLGSYHTAEEAAKVYDSAAKKFFGSYSLLNFPDNEVS